MKPDWDQMNEDIAKELGTYRTTSFPDGEKYYDGEDYCHSLDAMAQAEEHLAGPAEWLEYCKQILKRTTQWPVSDQQKCEALVSAEPQVKAVAFLIAKGREVPHQ